MAYAEVIGDGQKQLPATRLLPASKQEEHQYQRQHSECAGMPVFVELSMVR
jgi:hypothetical protein